MRWGRFPAAGCRASATRSRRLCGRSTRCSRSRARRRGVNFQTASYALNRLFTIAKIDGRWRAQVSPVYYGAMMFAQAAPAGSRLLALSGSPGTNLTAWATRAADGSTRVVLVYTAAHTRTVDLRIAGASVPATLERLRAPRLQAQSGVTLAGQRFGTSTSTAGSPARPPRARSRPPPACMWSACLGERCAVTLPAAQISH